MTRDPDTNHHETLEPLTPKELKTLWAHFFRESAHTLADRRAQYWCYATFGLVALLAVALLLIASLVTRREVVPYVVVYDPHGAVLWHGEAGRVTIDEAWIGTWVQEWIEWVRSQPDDLEVMGRWRRKAAAMVDGQAAKKLADYFAATDPLKPEHAQNRLRVVVKPESILRESPTMYRLTWEETWTPTYGVASEAHRMQALVTVDFRQKPSRLPKAALKVLRQDPRRLYVTDYSWAPIQQEGPRR